MVHDERDPFGEYAPEPQTAGTTVAAEAAAPDATETADEAATPDATEAAAEAATPDEADNKRYGSGKPRRIIVRGIVAADSGIKDTRK